MPTGQLEKGKINIYLKVFLGIYLFTVISGGLRKWFFSSKELDNFVLFLQIIIPYSLLIIKGGIKRWKVGVGVFSFLCFVFFVGILNPLRPSIYHGLLGALLHGSLAFIIFFYINNRSYFKFELILDWLVYLGFLQLALAFFQYSQPPDSLINTYADVEAVGSIATVGNSARVTGTFSYISGFTAFLFFHSFLVWAMFKYKYKSIYTIILLLMGMVACFMSGARSATYLYLILFLIICFNEYKALRKTVLDFKLILPILMIVTFLVGYGFDKIRYLVENAFIGFAERRDRGIQTGEESFRIFGDLNEVLNFRGNYPIIGVGLGSTYQGANKLFGTSPYVLEYGFFESELTRVILEGGYLLLITRAFVIVYLIKQLLIPVNAKIVIVIVLFFFYSSIFNIYNAVFAAIGIILIDHFYYREMTLSQMSRLKYNKVRNRLN